jgi:hypothetical protein
VDAPFVATEAADAVVEPSLRPESYVGDGAPVDRAGVVRPRYLSAEAWIEHAHGLPSPHPRLPLSRRFWFRIYAAQRWPAASVISSTRAPGSSDRDAQHAFWASLQLPPPARDEVRVSLFCSQNPAVVDALRRVGGR